MSAELFELVARSAVTGAKQALARDVEFDREPVVVVTVAWQDKDGNPFVAASEVPDGHGHELLAESLRQSAEETDGAS